MQSTAPWSVARRANASAASTSHDNEDFTDLICADAERQPSGPIASRPDKQNESGDQARYDKHPVLAFKTQNREMIDEKMHSFRPAFVQGKHFFGKNILFLYILLGRSGSVSSSFRYAKMLSNQDRRLSAGLSDSSFSNSGG
jgi:hypothetical protein